MEGVKCSVELSTFAEKALQNGVDFKNSTKYDERESATRLKPPESPNQKMPSSLNDCSISSLQLSKDVVDGIRIFVILLSTMAMSFGLTDAIGSDVILIPIIVMVLAQRPADTTSVGEVHQTMLASSLSTAIGICVAIAGSFAVGQSLLLLTFWSFFSTFSAFYYSFIAREHALPAALGIIVMFSILLSVFFAFTDDKTPLEDTFEARKSYIFQRCRAVTIILSLTFGIVMFASISIFPWFASNELPKSMNKMTHSMSDMMKLLEQKVIQVSRYYETVQTSMHSKSVTSFSMAKDGFIEEKSKRLKAYRSNWDRFDDTVKDFRTAYESVSKHLYPSRCEKRWRLDGSGTDDLDRFIPLHYIAKYATILYSTLKDYEVSSVENGISNRLELLRILRDVFCILSAILDSDMQDKDLLKARADDLDKKMVEMRSVVSVHTSGQGDLSDDPFYELVSSLVCRIARNLRQAIQVGTVQCEEVSRYRSFRLDDWITTLPFNLFIKDKFKFFTGTTATKSIAARKKSMVAETDHGVSTSAMRILWHITSCWASFAASDRYYMSLKVATASVVYIAIFVLTPARRVYRVEEMIIGLFSMHSVLRQFYIGRCWKRFLDRCAGVLLASVLCGICWSVASIGSADNKPQLTGWSMFLFIIPLTFLFIYAKRKHPKHIYVVYTLTKNFASISIVSYFEADPEDRYTSFWYVNLLVTTTTIMGCFMGLLFLPIVASVSAKSCLRQKLSHILKEMMYVTEAGFFIRRRYQNALLHLRPYFSQETYSTETQLQLERLQFAHRYIWTQISLTAPILLKAAESESGTEEPIEWFKKSQDEIRNMCRQLWRLNHLPLSNVRPADLEAACSRLASALYNLSADFSSQKPGVFLRARCDYTVEDLRRACSEDTYSTVEIAYQKMFWRIVSSIFDSINVLQELLEQRHGLPVYAQIDSFPSREEDPFLVVERV
mmetsp:Transcript_5830/g.7610  ORF Transcript_5830/g.7610 Transcript_5830/m.7610 type:complete len:952 (+) Transcript_5830:185-3040(+)